jgi:hypothetical protein
MAIQSHDIGALLCAAPVLACAVSIAAAQSTEQTLPPSR